MKKYDSASIESEKDRWVTMLSRKYPNEKRIFAAARQAGTSIGKYVMKARISIRVCSGFI